MVMQMDSDTIKRNILLYIRNALPNKVKPSDLPGYDMEGFNAHLMELHAHGYVSGKVITEFRHEDTLGLVEITPAGLRLLEQK